MQQDFISDFFEILKLIKESDSLAFSRFADGEANILKNNTVGNKDGWLYKKNKNLIFRADLRKSLMCIDSGYIYGISCSCCDKENHNFLLNNIKTVKENITFSNLWVNANYPLFQEHFLKTIAHTKKNIIICTNNKAKLKNLENFIHIKDFIPIKGNCITYWEKNKEYLRALLDLMGSIYKNSIFLFAAGPLSEILIYELWQINRANILIDIGSTLDPYLFSRKSRPYQNKNSEYFRKICIW